MVDEKRPSLAALWRKSLDAQAKTQGDCALETSDGLEMSTFIRYVENWIGIATIHKWPSILALKIKSGDVVHEDPDFLRASILENQGELRADHFVGVAREAVAWCLAQEGMICQLIPIKQDDGTEKIYLRLQPARR